MISMLRLAAALALVGSSIAALGGNHDGSNSMTHWSSPPRMRWMVPRAALSITVSWIPPDTNTDGSVLTNLAGYHIHYGTSSSSLDALIDVPTSGLTDYVVENLDPNTTYYFAVSSYNSAGVESSYSAVLGVTTS